MSKDAAVIAYKGFNKDLKCRGFQFEIGKTYTHEGPVRHCDSGFHACERPLDALAYYAPADSVYALVEQSGELSRENGGDSKIASSKITIKAAIDIPALVQATFDYTWERAKKTKKSHTDKHDGAASATGERGAASATGERGAASATGESGAASATGWSGAASATGWRGAASATGWSGAASATGWSGAASATGESGAASATGWRGAASATGGRGSASLTTGPYASSEAVDGATHAVAIALGRQSKARASKGNWIVLAERNSDGELLNLVTAQAGVTEGVKPDTWYVLKNSKIEEAA
jgi:hypothetical protein